MAPCTSLLLKSIHSWTNHKRSNEAVWKICKLITTSNILHCFIRINAEIFNNNPQEDINPLSHHGFFHAHVAHKDATVMPVLDPTYCASKDFHTKPLDLTTSTTISPFNSLKSNTVMIDFHKKPLTLKLQNTKHLSKKEERQSQRERRE